MSLHNWTTLRHLDSDLLKKVRLAFVFGTYGGEAIVITRENEVYAVGRNVSGCLGFDKSSLSRINAEKNSYLSEIDIKTIAAACAEPDSSSSNKKPEEAIWMVAVTKNGELYHWGSKSYVDSYGKQSRSLCSPYIIVMSDKVKEVACGTSHFLVLSETGKVYSWGRNSSGQLGHHNSFCSDPQGDGSSSIITGKIERKTVVEIACGSNFSLALIDDGTLFGWGCCKHGQLGFVKPANSSGYGDREQLEMYPVPIPISSAIKVQRIACGPAHVLALSRNGDVYGWGKNNLYQLGSEKYQSTHFNREPFQLKLKHRITDIAASYLHELSVAKTEGNEIIFCGQSVTKQTFPPTVSSYGSIDEAFAYLAGSMHKPLIVSENERISVTESLEKELGNKETSDLIIQTGLNEQIYVHKTILNMRSKYFKVKLPQLLKNNDKIVKVESKSFPAMKAYLQYVYTDKLQVDLDLAIELFKLAEKFEDIDFKILCEQNIKRQMTPEKVADLYSATRKRDGAEDLNKFCLDYAIRHAEEVMKSPGYESWDMDTLRTFVPEYIKSRGY